MFKVTTRNGKLVGVFDSEKEAQIEADDFTEQTGDEAFVDEHSEDEEGFDDDDNYRPIDRDLFDSPDEDDELDIDDRW